MILFWCPWPFQYSGGGIIQSVCKAQTAKMWMATVHPSVILLCRMEFPHLKQAPNLAGIPLNCEDPSFLSEPWYTIKSNNFKSNLGGNENSQENLMRFGSVFQYVTVFYSRKAEFPGESTAQKWRAPALPWPCRWVGHLTCLGPIFPIIKIVFLNFLIFSIHIEK